MDPFSRCSSNYSARREWHSSRTEESTFLGLTQSESMTTPSNHSAANGTILAKDLVHSSFRPPFVKIYYQGVRKNRAFSFDSLAENGKLSFAKIQEAWKQCINGEWERRYHRYDTSFALYVKDDVSSMTILLNDEDVSLALDSWGLRILQKEQEAVAAPSRIYARAEDEEKKVAADRNEKSALNIYMQHE